MQKRDYLFDNLKLFLILLVVLVHLFAAIGRVDDVHPLGIDLFMLTVCSFHMPLFMFVSGYFSKNLQKTNAKARNLLFTYFFVQILFALFNLFVLHQHVNVMDLLTPAFSMWFIFVLIVLKWMLPALVKVRYLLIWLLIFNVLSMVADPNGYVEKAILKVVAFAIFFMLGYYATPAHIQKIRRQPWFLHVGILAGCMMSMFLFTRILHPRLISLHVLRNLMLHNAYLDDTGPGPIGMGAPGLLWGCYALAIALLMGTAVIGLFPDRPMRLTHIGGNTLPIYIAQAFAYKIYKIAAATPFLKAHPVCNFSLAGCLAVAIVLIFGSDKVAHGLNCLLQSLKAFLRARLRLADIDIPDDPF